MSDLIKIEPAAELVAEIRKTGIEPASGEAIAAAFAPHFRDFHAVAGEAGKIGTDQPKAARDMRLRLKAVRVAGETTRKALKADVLLRGRAIDGVQALLELSLVPVEKSMEDIEKAEERREQARKAALADARRAELAPFCDPTHYQLGDMPDAAYAQLLAGAKSAKAAADEAARKAAEQAEADAKALAEAHAKKVAEAEAERKRLAEEAAAAKAAKEAADAELAKEREAARVAKAEADRLAKIAADRAAKEAAEIAKRQAELDALAKAPDREKLAAFAAAIRGLQVPVLSPDRKAVQDLMVEQVEKFARFVEARGAAL